jgi:hypothetical protein
LLGGAHRLALAGQDPVLEAHFPTTGGDGDVHATFEALVALVAAPPSMVREALGHPPQTNDVGRSGALVPGFLQVARDTGLPLRLRELGTSAALNLRVDRYRYEQDGMAWGDPASGVRLVDLWDGAAPPLDEPAIIVDRRGCDHDPIDVADEATALALLSYVWPGQDERFDLLRAALDAAVHHPVAIDRADIGDWVEQQLAEPCPGTATVVFNSFVWQYLNGPTRARVIDALAEAGGRARPDAPVAWMRLEPAEAGWPVELRLTLWDGSAASGRERLLATTGGHGGPVTWLDQE